MTSLRVRPLLANRPPRHAQRGVILILTLIALVVLLIGVAAMLRTTDNATAVIGNLAFRRDLTNRAEVAIATAKAALSSGGAVYTDTVRNSDLATSNYSATRLPNATSIGVPAVLLSNNNYGTAKYQCLPTSCLPGTDGIVLRWVIDRQCSGTNATTVTFSIAACGYLGNTKDKGGTDWLNPRKPDSSARGLFRISVRVSGPRNTEAYIQTTAG